MTTFPIRYTGINRAFRYMGLGPRSSGVDVEDEVLRVRFGWGFHLEAPRSMVTSVALDHSRVTGWGAHGWRNVWLVNGSSSGIVRIDLREKVRARMMFVPLNVRAVRVSVEDPDGLVAALT